MSKAKNPPHDQAYHQWVEELGLRAKIDSGESMEKDLAELLGRTRANSIRQRRIENKLRMKDLAELLGVSIATISAYERGITSPSLRRLKQIAEIFNCSLEEISQVNWEAKRVRREV